MEFTSVSKNCKKEWYILRIFLLVIALTVTAVVAIIDFNGETLAKILVLIPIGLFDIYLIIYAFIFPSLQYNRYKYQISEDRIETKSGVIFLRHKIVPFIRMQHIVVFRGVLDRIFNMSTVIIFTAGSCVRLRNLGTTQALEVTESIKSILKQKEEKGEVENDG